MNSIRNVLVVQPYGLGDALFTTPLLRALRTLPSVERVDLLLGSRTEEIFRNNPHVDQVFSLDKGRLQKMGTPELLRELLSWQGKLAGRYDLMIDFSLQREYGFYGGFFLGIPRRIGFNFKNRGIFLTRSVPLVDGFERKSVVEFYVEVGRLIGLEIEEPFLEFYVSEEERRRAAEIFRTSGKSYLAVAPGGGESWGKDAHFKRWPVEKFSALLGKIRERISFDEVVILGSVSEEKLGEELSKVPGTLKVPGTFGGASEVKNLCGKLSIGETAAVLEGAKLFIGNDGGLIHLAQAMKVPTVALFGPVDPVVYGPFPRSSRSAVVTRESLPCRPCYFGFRYNSRCVDRECLTALEPEEVVKMLDGKNFWTAVQ